VDMENPTAREIRALIDERQVPPAVGEELIRPTWRPRAERHGDLIHLTLHFPISRRRKDNTTDTDDEIDFLVGKHFVATVHYRHNDALYRLGKEVDAAALLKRGVGGSGPELFVHITRALYDALFVELGENTTSLGHIEQGVFRGDARAMVGALSEAGRELLDMQRAISFHKELMDSFGRAAAALGGEGGLAPTRHLLSDIARLEFAIRRNMDLLSELRETNNSLLNARETATMRVIAVIAFLTLPASVLTNFFQMATDNTPLIGLPYDWFLITGITLVLTVLLLFIAKKQKWL